MNQPSAYVIGNVFFIAVNVPYDCQVPRKYLQACSAGVYTLDIWTQEEILTKYPDAKPCIDLARLTETYNQR